MPLPNPLPDDPTKWEGWRRFNSEDFYERLSLTFDAHPTSEEIEENTRLLLVWWQKKLPLKNQPSNPMAQLLRGGIDLAPRLISEARAELSNPARRAEIDLALTERRRQNALVEFQKFLDFALTEKVLTKEAESNLYKLARALGLPGSDATLTIHKGLISAGATREADLQPPPDLYASVMRPAAANDANGPARLVMPHDQFSPDEERRRFEPFENSLGIKMLLVPTGRFMMGSRTPEAPLDEQPTTQVTLRRFYVSRHPITNAEYEQFDPAHQKWRSPTGGDRHPAVYVNHFDAVKFCAWLSEREEKRYRLPTEAEWEYAARGTDGRIFPWAPTRKVSLTKFTLTRGNDDGTGDSLETIGDGKVAPGSETTPVGRYPRGASPFGIEDLLGNVWEWCQDFYGTYKGAERMNPSGPEQGTHRVYRGGSWKTRSAMLKATTRGCNVPTYASTDVGFRIVCECE